MPHNRIIAFLLSLVLYGLFITSIFGTNSDASAKLPLEADFFSIELTDECQWIRINDAVVRDDMAYCAVSFGLVVVDISITGSPYQIGRLLIPGDETEHIRVAGDYAYLINDIGLHIIDIIDPSSPSLVHTYEQSYVNALDVADTVVYLAGGTGLHLISIGDPGSPYELGSTYVYSFASDIEVVGDHAFVTSANVEPYSGALQIFNVSVPSMPFETGKYISASEAFSVAVAGNYAFMSEYYQFEIIDITDLHDPTPVGTYSPGGEDLAAADTLLYIAGVNPDLRIISVTDPAAPYEIGSYDTERSAVSVTIGDDFAYLVDLAGLSLVNIADPGTPSPDGRYRHFGEGRDMYLDGKFAYVVGLGLHVIYMDQSRGCYRVSSCYFPGYANALDIVDTFAYAVTTDSMLAVFSIADAHDMYMIASYPLGTYPHDLSISGSYAYIAAEEPDVLVVDISDPSNLQTMGNLSLWPSDGAVGITTLGYSAYVIGHGRMQVVDIENHEAPFARGGVDITGRPVDVTHYGSQVYVAAVNDDFLMGSLEIIDASDPDQPISTYSQMTPGELLSVGVCPYGAHVFAGGFGGMDVFLVTNPELPSWLGTYALQPPVTMAVDDTSVYVTGFYGFSVYRYASHLCGDANYDGRINVGDAVRLILYIFDGDFPPPWSCLYEVNGDEQVNVGDVVYLINYIFKSGAPPISGCCSE